MQTVSIIKLHFKNTTSPLFLPTKPLKHLFASHVAPLSYFKTSTFLILIFLWLYAFICTNELWMNGKHLNMALLSEIKSAVPSRTPATSPRNNGSETRAEGWSFLLWQASKQPAGWMAVIGVKCPQLAVHCSLASISPSPLRKEEGGQVQVWDSADSLMWR